jgi:hypothetical protein
MRGICGLVRKICLMCIRFPLQAVDQFESTQLSDMSNWLSCDNHHINNLME